MSGVAATVHRIKVEALQNLPDDPACSDDDPLYEGIEDSIEWLAMIVVDVRMPMDMRMSSAEMLSELAPSSALREKFAAFVDANS
jgi:hypothetical protein